MPNTPPSRAAIAAALAHHHALFPLLPAHHREALVDFVQRFISPRISELSVGEPPIDLLVAANAALVGMYQPVGHFSSIDWIYIGRSDDNHDGEAWGINKVLLDVDAVMAESAHIIPGANVVIHEFAHVMDHHLGLSGRTPALRAALEDHLQTLNKAAPSCIVDWRDSIPIDMVVHNDFHYLEQSEFFAYASESFFTAAPALKVELPGLYAELQAIYKIDMAEVLRGRG